MNNKHFSKGKLKKALSLLLAFALWAAMLLGNSQPAYAAENGISAPITDPAEQARALGFDTTQGQRTDENGNPVDATKHPLGLDMSYFNRISQVGVISNTSLKVGSGVSNLPLTNDGLKTNQDLMKLNGVLDDKSLNAPKVSVAADFGGIGDFGQENPGSTQVFVTAAIPQNKDNSLKYDGASFIKHDVAQPKATKKYKNSDLRYQHKSGHWYKDITDIYGGVKGEDSTYIISTIIGNFDGNLSGREQVLMLHYNRFYDGEHVFLTWCGREDNNSTDITTHLTKIWGGDQGKTNYPSVTAIDVLNTGITVVAKPELTTFTFSDPTVIAVLGAAPYYKELNEQSGEYSGTIGNIGTTYGTGVEKSSSLGGGISASAGVTFGFEDGLSIFGKKIFSQEFEVEVKSSFTQSWTSTT